MKIRGGRYNKYNMMNPFAHNDLEEERIINWWLVVYFLIIRIHLYVKIFMELTLNIEMNINIIVKKRIINDNKW